MLNKLVYNFARKIVKPPLVPVVVKQPNERELVMKRAENAIAKAKEDKQFKQLAELDQDNSDKEMSMFVERPKRGDGRLPRVIDKMEKNTF